MKVKAPPPVPKRHLKTYQAYLNHLRQRRATGGLAPYSTYARRFLQFADQRTLTRQTVEAYLASLNGHKSQTKRFIFGVIRSLFRVNNTEWPFRHGEGPRYEHDANTPALHPQAVIQMIRAARAGKLEPEEVACLALVTIYGLRSEEISRLEAPHINFRDHLLTITTAKGEAPRLHLIPDEIADVLRAWGFRKRLYKERVKAIWYQLELKAGVERIERVGWHSVRRTLDTLLREKLNPTIVQVFLGWSMRSSSDMSARYHQVTFVGWGKQEAYQPQWRKELDQTVFAQHPFLAAWKRK